MDDAGQLLFYVCPPRVEWFGLVRDLEVCVEKGGRAGWLPVESLIPFLSSFLDRLNSP